MKRPIAKTGTASFGWGFSLVELLMVIAMLAILTALVMPAVSGISRGYGLTTAGHSVVNALVQARQAAMTRGYPVQVRIYKLPGYSQPNTERQRVSAPFRLSWRETPRIPIIPPAWRSHRFPVRYFSMRRSRS